MLPERIQMSAWNRLYRGKHARWAALYDGADLRYGNRVRMQLQPGDVISDCIAFTGVYEPRLTRRVAELAKAGGFFIDVGANLGYFSLLWASVLPENRCLAFEPSPRSIEFLRRNVSLNDLESQIEVAPQAAGQSSGRAWFDPGPTDQTGWGGFAAREATRGIEIAVVRVDEVVSDMRPIALLKVDVEGADAWALMGCERLLRARCVREVWFEQNKARSRALGISESAAQDYLASVGYSPQPLTDAEGEVVEWRAVPR